ncbi:hypothetical protein ACS73_16710 [Pseudomonas lini]|nr:hypothetical protein ACS73_16710 [Pseudomonas lini]
MSHQCVIAILGTLPVRALPSRTVDLYARAFSEFQLQTGRPPYRMPGLAIGMSHCSECGARVEPDLVIDEILLQMKALESDQEYPKIVTGAIDEWAQHARDSLVAADNADPAHRVETEGGANYSDIQGAAGATA